MCTYIHYLHCIALHCLTLRYLTLRYVALHYRHTHTHGFKKTIRDQVWFRRMRGKMVLVDDNLANWETSFKAS